MKWPQAASKGDGLKRPRTPPSASLGLLEGPYCVQDGHALAGLDVVVLTVAWDDEPEAALEGGLQGLLDRLGLCLVLEGLLVGAARH